jgi:hypothetical protein
VHGTSLEIPTRFGSSDPERVRMHQSRRSPEREGGPNNPVKQFQFIVLAGALLGGLVSTDAAAQQVAADQGSGEARLQFGWLALDPRLSVRDVGVDTNVFNEANGATRDVTATVGPEVASWVRAGRLYLNGMTTVGWTYFQKSTEQRSIDFSQVGRADLALVRFTPHAGGAYERTRRRPNDEIDARVRQLRTRANGGLAVHPGPRLTLDLSYELRAFDFGEGEFGDVVLAQQLNRSEGEATLSTSWAMTPLTTFVVKGAHRVDEFEAATERDSRSINVMSGLEFKPAALISGSAFVGFRSFSPTRNDLPGFNGLAAAVDLHYTARDRLRLNAAVSRDVDYSFEPELPYYVSTSVRTDAMQAIGGAWDVVGRLAVTRMAYQAFNRIGVVAPDRNDRTWLVGTGVGRRLGTDVRVGVDVNYVTRVSSVAFRDYSGMRVGGSVTYGY